MQDIGPGTLIADRYAVSHRIQQHPRWERWAATDTGTGRDVVVLTFAGDTPAAAAAVDAARRAAAVADTRLVRILDVVPGPDTESPDIFAVVEEPLVGARTLTRILGQGGLPGDEARRITGETATALDAAAARGLRHVVLTPRNVLLLPDGSVRVRGVAVEAALLGLEDTPAAVASRLDARALVGIGYAALTGRWPLAGADSGLPRAPIVGGSVAAPDELAADVCPDLDRLARATLVEGAGPITAGDVRAALRPWPSGPTIDLTADRRGGPVAPGALGRGGVEPAPSGHASTSGAGGVSTSDLYSVGTQGNSPEQGTGSGSALGGVGAVVSDTGAGATTGAAARAGTGGTTGAGAAAAALGSAGAAAMSGLTAAVGKGARGLGAALGSAGSATAAAASRLGERTRHTVDRLAARGGSGGEQPAADTDATGTDVPGGTSPDEPAGPRAGVERPAGAEPTPSAGAGRRSGATRTAGTPGRAMPRRPEFYLEDATLMSVLNGGQAPVDAPVPLVPEPGHMGREESRLALAIVAGLVVLLAVLGIWGLPRLTVSTPAPPRPSATITASATGTAGTAGAGGAGAAAVQTAQPAAASALVAVPIAGAATFDANVGQVASSSAARAFDGNPDTMWRSGWFANEKFGGLKTTGVGLILDLEQQTQVRQVTVTVPVAQDLTVYVASRASLDGATSIGTSAGRTGTLTFEVPAGPVVSGQLVIVYVTKLGPDGSGRFRAQVSEVAVSR